MFSTVGGVQTFSRHFLHALSTNVSCEGIRILLKNDSREGAINYNGFRHVNGCGRWPSALRSARFASECLRWAWFEQPRLIISTHLNFGPIAQIVREVTGTPYVLVAHGIDAWDLKSKSRKKALQKADLVLAVSRYTRDRLLKDIGLDPKGVHILSNTFLPQNFTINSKSPRLLEKYGFTSCTPIILTVCRLPGAERYKGYEQIIRALPQILRAVPNAKYLLAGSGPDRRRIEKLVSELNLQETVRLVGFIPDEELNEYYNLCDVFAMPSKGEGFGIVYLEALACGKPVLAGNKDGSRDALNDGELGILVDPDNISAIAEQTIRVLHRNHSHANIFRPELLRQRVIELFGFEKFKSTLAARLEPFLTQETTMVRGADKLRAG